MKIKRGGENPTTLLTLAETLSDQDHLEDLCRDRELITNLLAAARLHESAKTQASISSMFAEIMVRSQEA